MINILNNFDFLRGLKKTMCYLIKSQENVNNEFKGEDGLGIEDKMLAKNLSTSSMNAPKNLQQSILDALSFSSLHSTEVCFLCKRSSSTNISFKESLIDKINFLKPASRMNKLIQCNYCSNLVCQSCGNSTSNEFKINQNVS